MRIAWLPYGYVLAGELADVSLADLRWALGVPPTSGTIGDLSADDHLVAYFQKGMVTRCHPRVRCKVSIVLAEPFVIFWRAYLLTGLFSRRFFRIATHFHPFIRLVANARFIPPGNAWATPAVDGVAKTRRVSLVASTKRSTVGHKLRHSVANWVRETKADVDLLGLGYRPIADKSEGHSLYMFSIVIENSREAGYFTEKLIDAFLCESVPIYWGAPDISEFFDSRGIIECSSFEAITASVASITPQQFSRLRSYVEFNKSLAMAYRDYNARVADMIAREASPSDDQVRT